MTSEVQIFNKDKIRMNILQDVLGGMIGLGFQLDNGQLRDYASGIHEDGKRVYVLGKFNVSEDATDGDTITIRPIMVDTPLKIVFSPNANFSGKKVSVVRSATKSVEQEYEISSQTSSIELIPQGKQSYLMKVTNDGGVAAKPVQSIPQQKPKPSSKPSSIPKPERVKPSEPAGSFEEVTIPQTGSGPIDDRFEGFSMGPSFGGSDSRFDSFDVGPSPVIASTVQQQDIRLDEEIESRTYVNDNRQPAKPAVNNQYQDDTDLQRIEQEISVIEQQQGQLSRKKQSAIDHLEKIEAEYKKDYASLEKELEDIKAQMDADASIIEHYKDQDVMPIEIIFQEIRMKLEEAESQIRFFIEAKQRKTMEIENEIKSNKRQ